MQINATACTWDMGVGVVCAVATTGVSERLIDPFDEEKKGRREGASPPLLLIHH